jgi:RNA-directed DNA polymerase
MTATKPFQISKHIVWDAYLQVKRSKGSPGYDNENMDTFEKDLKNNLYKLWNRLSSGTYFPPPVLEVEIPKADGKIRKLGIPTVSDRIAQTVIKRYLEPIVEPHFHEDSYGYRPKKSALQAIGQARWRCWRDNWVLDLDIKSFFDTIDHRLMMAAVKKFTHEPFLLLYIERWLKADNITKEGTKTKRDIGTPQGGVISPLLANIFLHLTYDKWMQDNYPNIHFERYADDIVVHCRSEKQLEMLKGKLIKRFALCKLALHPEKTKIVYCKDANRKEEYDSVSFDFLGYTFRPRLVRDKKNAFFVSFSPAISAKAAKNIRQTVKHKWKLKMRSELNLEELAALYNPVIRGWINYYSRFHGSALYSKVFEYINTTLMRWAMKKYKQLYRRPTRASSWLKRTQLEHSNLFEHWKFKCS